MSTENLRVLEEHLNLFSDLQSDIVGRIFSEEGESPIATYLQRDGLFKMGPFFEPFPKYMIFKDQGEIYGVQEDGTEVGIGDDLTQNGLQSLLIGDPRIYSKFISNGLLKVESPEDSSKGPFTTSYDIERVGEEILMMPKKAAQMQSDVYGREWQTIFRLTDRMMELEMKMPYSQFSGPLVIKYNLP